MRLLLPATLLLASAATSAFAQPTVTSSALPIAGFNANVQYGNMSSMVAPGAAGANMTWNFASLSGTNLASTYIYEACPGATGCSTFPGSNLKGTENAGSAVGSYYSIASGIQAITGLTSGGQDIIYSNPEDYIRTPMTFNSTFTDPFAATIVSSTPVYRVGSATNLADGYGTLTTPAGTFSNVLRVKRTSIYRDSIAGFGIVANHNAITYLWYSPSVRDYLFYTSSLTSTIAGGSPASAYAAGYRTGVTASVDEGGAQQFYQLSPNPASDHFTMRWDAATQATVTLIDLTGRTLAQQAGRGGVTFRVDELPRGLYLLRIQDASGAVHSQKVTLR